MVYLVGAGPGDPGLITVRGKQLLERAEVVIYDYLASKKLLKYVPRDAEFIYAGKRGGVKHTHTQEEINRMLIDRALSGRRVIRLKGGDPFIFGRGGEEIEELVKEGISFEVVPGVTSATAAATYAGIPITHRQYTSTVAFVTGHEDPTKPDSNIAWDKLATGVGTIVVYMGIKNLESITKKVIKYGRDPKTPVAVVRWASTSEQRTVVGNLENIASIVRKNNIKPPSLVVIGEVVNLRDTLNWYENRPLFSKRVVVTRTRDQASELVTLLESYGAECLEYPTISLEPVPSYEVLDQALSELETYHWLLFTSINAVDYFFKRLFQLGRDVRDLKGPRIAAVGRVTAEALASHGIRADLLPEEFTGEGLAETLIKKDVEGLRVLIPRALKAREILPETLSKAGAEITVAPVYQNVLPASTPGAHLKEELLTALQEKSIHMVTFTSSSTVKNFVTLLGSGTPAEVQQLMSGIAVATIGPITAKTAEKFGMHVDVQPTEYTIPDLVDSIVKYFTSQPAA
ncbi:MAG: uroporphyrinogen-III C-methyltransferase [Deltaproteobacteria bacterium]|nr:uroporphyrinogen-III C-methyltransferase [Deltaproteobacteria bacterium]